MRQYRQGDVFIDEVLEIGLSVKPVNEIRGHHILAHGEATGHAHRIEATENVEFFQGQYFHYLRISPGDPVIVKHEEHLPIEIPPGTYIVRRQREYVPNQLPRLVAD